MEVINETPGKAGATWVLAKCGRCGNPVKRRVSQTHGNVYCSRKCFKRPLEERFWEKVDKTSSPNGCWVWKASQSSGYGCFPCEYGIRAHRVSWILTNGPVPKNKYVCHNCPNKHNPLCVNPAHLKVQSKKEDIADQVRMGTRAITRGVDCKKSNLNEDKVRGIRSDAAAGMARKGIAEKWGLAITTIHDILSGRTWKHVV